MALEAIRVVSGTEEKLHRKAPSHKCIKNDAKKKQEIICGVYFSTEHVFFNRGSFFFIRGGHFLFEGPTDSARTPTFGSILLVISCYMLAAPMTRQIPVYL